MARGGAGCGAAMREGCRFDVPARLFHGNNAGLSGRRFLFHSEKKAFFIFSPLSEKYAISLFS
jgi:hypothetical protein